MFSLIFYAETVKPHFVSSSCREACVADLGARFADVVEEWPDPKWLGGVMCIDRGGMQSGPTVDVFIEGSTLRVLARDFDYYYMKLLRQPARSIGNQRLYKLHGSTHCLVLDAHQREIVLNQWRGLASSLI